MLVYMTKTEKGSPDCFAVNHYKQGCIYDLPDNLGTRFLLKGSGLNLPEEDLAGFDGLHPANKITVEKNE